MPRIRSVHPGLFRDEAFVSLSAFARLAWIGLWTEADDKGVFEWKPLQIKMTVFPADSVDIAELLDELLSVDFVRRYEVVGKTYGAIRNFRRFQRPRKPNDLHPLPPEFGSYVGLEPFGTEPVGNRYGNGSEKSPQMEDGGWKREGGGGSNKKNHGRGASKGTYARVKSGEPLHDADGVVEDDWEFAE